MRLRSRVAVVAVFLGTHVSSAEAANQMTLNVDLDELRGAELLQFMRAVVPEVYGGESRPRLDLSTLARLHAHLLANAGFLTRREETLHGQEVRKALERVMRQTLVKIDLPTVRRLTLGDGKRDYGNGHLFEALCQRWIEKEITKIVAEPQRKLLFPTGASPLPDRFQIPPVADLDATELGRALGPFANLLEQTGKREPRGIHQQSVGFDELSRGFLMERNPKIAGELLRFTWDSWCGTGAAEWEATKMTLVFMGLLRERRIPEAVGVSFFVPDAPEWTREPGQPFDKWRIDLLKYCGFDWETVLLAAGRVDFLAAAGSEKSARHGLATLKSDRPEHEKGPWDLAKLVAFLAPKYSDDADVRKAISPETQAEILALLNSSLRNDLPFHELDRVVTLFEELKRPETKETMRTLRQHPSTTYAQRAAFVLSHLGDEFEEVPPAPPVRFRLLLNKQPWRSAELFFRVIDGATPHPNWMYLRTDAEGFASIPRDEFLDPAKRGTRLRFTKNPTGGGVWTERLYDQAWVESEAPFPTVSDAETEVHFTACRVAIEISYASPLPPLGQGGGVEFSLRTAGESNSNAAAFTLNFTDQRVPPPEHFALNAIAPGSYQLSMLAPGSARYLSEPFEVKDGMPPVKINLEKGAHINASLLMPANARGAHEIRLFRGEQDVTDQFGRHNVSGQLFAGLPKGSYRLRVLSTTEFMRKHGITEWKAPESLRQEDLRNGVDCEGVNVEFTIDDTTPPLLNLGRIENKPIASMRDKAGRMRTLR